MPNALALTLQLYVDGAWTTYAGYTEEGWLTQIGPDVDSGDQPNSIQFTLNNDDLSMDPSNLLSPLYGKIGRNTPARLLIGGTTITRAEASAWAPTRTSNHVPGAAKGLSSVRFTAEGLLRRLAKWSEPLRSPLVRQTLSYSSLIGYWPLEDEAGVLQLAQVARTGSGRARVAGTYTLRGDAGAGGSDQVLQLGSDGTVAGNFARVTTGGYQVSWVQRAGAAAGSASYVQLFTFTDTVGRRYAWEVNNTNFRISLYDVDGTVIVNPATPYGSLPLTNYVRYRIKVTWSAGILTYEPAWYNQDASFSAGITQTTATSAGAGAPYAWSANGNGVVAGGSVSHVLAVTDTAMDLVSGSAGAAFNGYLAERAGSRWSRLMVEEGLLGYIGGSVADTAQMGRQKPGVLMDLLRECVVTDGALMYDEPSDIALTFRTRVNRMNQTPVLALAKTSVASMQKVIDDSGIANQVVVSNSDGTEFTAQLTSGPLSIKPPPAGIGVVKQDLDVNLSDPAAVDDRGTWALNGTTLDRPRYKDITIDLLTNPGLTAAVTSLRPGDLVTLTGEEPEAIRLHVMTIRQEGGGVRRTATLACVPAELFDIFVIDDAGSLLDSASTTLASGVTSTATSIPLTTVGVQDVWSTTNLPYSCRISLAGKTDGERVTVTAMTAAAGAGPYTQTATVTRNVNGAARAWAAGSEFHIADPKRLA
jgi:hypothetical protein